MAETHVEPLWIEMYLKGINASRKGFMSVIIQSPSVILDINLQWLKNT